MTSHLIVGIDAAIGRALAAALAARGDAVVGTTRRDVPAGAKDPVRFDLARSDVATLPAADVTIICAAMARYADCRERPDLAHRIDVEAPRKIAQAVAARGGRTLLFSTSAVFDGQQPFVPANAAPSARSAYGRLKAEAEAVVLATGPGASVLRLSKVFTPNMPLITGWIDRLRQGQPVSAFRDLTASPLAMRHVVAAALAALDDGAGGIYQMSGAGDVSYADIARHLAHRLGADPALVTETLAVENGIPPDELSPCTSLDCTRLSAFAGLTPPLPYDVLDDVFGLARHGGSGRGTNGT